MIRDKQEQTLFMDFHNIKMPYGHPSDIDMMWIARNGFLIIEPALKMFKEATGYDRHKVMVYILVNYNTTLEEDLHRINYVGRELGFQPYPMIYNKEHCDPIYNKLQRWCNPRIFNSTKSFKEYDRL